MAPRETVRIVMTFEDIADEARPYIYHCHILEYEENGMMGQFLVVQVSPNDSTKFVLGLFD